ncbi:hypothetical protein BGZ76_000386 [Entomortierella beljakovae]|nr:hypothetical protein BGZ76_000386 [Entomortierella beljakovae]
MSDSAASKPTPFGQFCFFKNLSYSLFEDDWINMVESWQAMVAVNAPIPEFSYNMTPFFANAPRLLTTFHRYMEFADMDQEFLPTLTNVLMSTPLLIKVQHILHSTELFSAYIVALKLDNPSASHSQVMQSLQTFLSELPEEKRLEIQRVFAEEEAHDSMGFTSYTLDTALQLLHADTQLYIDILSTLQLNQTENMPWEQIVSKIQAMVLEKKPQAWDGIDQFLQNLHWTPQPQDISLDAFDAENDDDDIIEMVEGVDYYSEDDDDDEQDDYDQHLAVFLQGVQEIQSGRNFAEDFSKMGVSDHRQTVESC